MNVQSPHLVLLSLGLLAGMSACRSSAPALENPDSTAPAEPTKTAKTTPPDAQTPTLPKVVAKAEPPGFDHEHAALHTLLQRFVKDGVVDYSGLKQERAALTAYLATLSAVEDHDGWSDADKLAFWINAYNAWTLDLIFEAWPVKSIKSLYPPDGPWKRAFITLALHPDKVSLNWIEHEVVRKQFKEPRIHFALVCASVSCPPLRNEAFTSNRLDEQLEDQAKIFLRDTSKNTLDIRRKTFRLSKIFEWYGGDFAGDAKAVARRIAPWMGPEAEALAKNPKMTVAFLPYDWGLNGR